MHAILPVIYLAAIAAAPQFDVRMLDGSQATGAIAQWDAAQMALETPTGRTAVETAKVASVSLREPGTPPIKPAVWVDLIDGSKLVGLQYTAEKGRSRITLSAEETFEVPTAEVDAVRLLASSDAAAAEWARIRAKASRGDVLVTGTAGALDDHVGTIEDVTDVKVRFVLNTQPLGVKREKIFGLIYYHASSLPAAECPYTVVDSSGSRWLATSLKIADGSAEFVIPGNRTVRRGLDRIAQIDLSCGKIVFLSDLKPDSETVIPPAFTATAKELPSREAFFRPRRDQNLESRPLRLNAPEERTYGKGLALHSRSELAWTLPGKFSRLEAVAGLDNRVPALGGVRLQLIGDGKPLLDETFTAEEKTLKIAARPIRADLTGVRRLVLIVDSLGNFGAGDRLNLADLRLIK